MYPTSLKRRNYTWPQRPLFPPWILCIVLSCGCLLVTILFLLVTSVTVTVTDDLFLNTSYRKAPALVASCPEYYADPILELQLHAVKT
jgi:hypothetical protein